MSPFNFEYGPMSSVGNPPKVASNSWATLCPQAKPASSIRRSAHHAIEGNFLASSFANS